jgi:hypothetical protein
LPRKDLQPQAGRPRYIAEVQKETDFGMMTTEHLLGMVFSIGGTREDRQRIFLDNP